MNKIDEEKESESGPKGSSSEGVDDSGPLGL